MFATIVQFQKLHEDLRDVNSINWWAEPHSADGNFAQSKHSMSQNALAPSAHLSFVLISRLPEAALQLDTLILNLQAATHPPRASTSYSLIPKPDS
mmetsp:Transcript_13093/g.20566  ORF Transcript_13093/g.20566 Transcript_13093/m.20566 type:complete len:96 (-) Transcript_13093:216-503(-)